MNKWIVGVLATGLAVVIGCGPESKVADKPTDEQIRMDQEEQKKVEAEERGPVQKKRK